MINKLKRLKTISYIIHLLSPGFGRCSNCGLPWNRCKEKTVYTNQFEGTFATCEYCWDNSSLDVLKNCYSRTYDMQFCGLLRMNSQMKTDEKMTHDKNHLLKCVEKEFNKENIKRRKQKIKSLKRKIKKNVTLH